MTLPARLTSVRWLGLLAALAVVAWLWACWCLFPVKAWNDVRLVPAFALARGVPLYPGETSGAVGTWIYGPLPALLLWPATWASSAAQALLTAGALNLLLTVGAIAAVCAAWPAPVGRTGGSAPVRADEAKARASGRTGGAPVRRSTGGRTAARRD